MRERIPGLFLSMPALEHNISTMTAWCAAADVLLAPHIKTTMTREIVERQLAAGAWGVTVATPAQAICGAAWGARRIIVANEIVTSDGLAALVDLAALPDGPELLLFVDSPDGVDRVCAALLAQPAANCSLLIDVGVVGGRTGVRTVDEARSLARHIADRPALRLAGIAAYEGVRPNRRDAETLALVDAHCDATLEIFHQLRALITRESPVFSMGGSAFPDRVTSAIERYRASGADLFTAVLRSGCYVTHDHGTYADVSPIDGLQPALHVRAVVCSVPEPGLAVIAAGKRELPYDAGLPVLLRASAPDGSTRASARGTATAMFDHHLVLSDAHDLHIGDVVDLGISHPCSAFDRWRDVQVLNSNGAVVDAWPTHFER